CMVMRGPVASAVPLARRILTRGHEVRAASHRAHRLRSEAGAPQPLRSNRPAGRAESRVDQRAELRGREGLVESLATLALDELLGPVREGAAGHEHEA